MMKPSVKSIILSGARLITSVLNCYDTEKPLRFLPIFQSPLSRLRASSNSSLLAGAILITFSADSQFKASKADASSTFNSSSEFSFGVAKPESMFFSFGTTSLSCTWSQYVPYCPSTTFSGSINLNIRGGLLSNSMTKCTSGTLWSSQKRKVSPVIFQLQTGFISDFSKTICPPYFQIQSK